MAVEHSTGCSAPSPSPTATTTGVSARVRAGVSASTDTGRSRSGTAAALVSLFLIGSAAPVAALLQHAPVLAGQGLRYLVSSVVLVIIMITTGRLRSLVPRPADLPRIALLGLIGTAGFTASFVEATRYADPALIGSVLAATPVLLALLGPILRRRPPAAGVLLGAALVAGGTALATGSGSSTGPGLLLGLVALGCEVGFSLLALPLITRYGTLATTTFAAIAGALLLLLGSVVVEGPEAVGLAGTDRHDLPVLIFLGLAVSVGANLAWYTALPRLGADRAGLFYAFSPIGALTAGLLLHTSSPGAGELAGLAVVIIGLLVGLRSAPPRRDP